MHSTMAFVLALAFGVSQAVAQTTLSAAFNLVVSSTNKTLDGTFLGACHEGAAFEGLCPTAPNATLPYEQYKLNYTSSATADPVLGITGQLTWLLQAVNVNDSSPLSIRADITTNVAVPEFVPDLGSEYPITYVGFDKDGKLFVPQYNDDTVVPAKPNSKPLYHWFVCTTDLGYVYSTLAWVIGPNDPENPSCQKVDVKRVFV